jgi:pSer/pThr/pTyr-binding forkhead associated (FHA) protein/chromosome segregation ATPase
MSLYPINQFRTSCGATDPLELNVSGPGWDGGGRRGFDLPFVLVGRDERNGLRLEDEAVSRRHAYLQQLGGRVFCVDLDSRTGIRWGGEVRRAGWLRPDQGIQIGPFTLEHVMADQAGGVPGGGVATEWNPLQDPVNDPGLLPWIIAERDNIVLAQMRMNRVMVLAGSLPSCRVRLPDARVSRLHCCLVRTAQGVWVIDLLSKNGTCLNDQPVRWALVKEGDRLRVGPYVLRVWYQAVGKQTPLPRLPGIRAETSVQSADHKLEAVPLGSVPDQALTELGEEPSASAMCTLVSTLPGELDEARERQQEAEALRQQLADSHSECDRLREQAHTLEIEVAEAADLQARLQAAQASARELQAVRAERDQWRSEAQELQTRIAADASEREELRQQLAAAQQQHGEEREAVRAAHLRLDQESATLQQVRADFAARNAEYDLVGQRWQATHHELARAQDETRSLQAELEQAHQRLRDAETLSQLLENTRAKHDQLCARVPELEGRATSAERLCSQLQNAEEEVELLRAQLREAESHMADKEDMRSECVRQLERARVLEIRVAEAAGLQARLEAAEAKARATEAVCVERDHWRSEAQALQTRIVSDSSEREELRQRLEAVQQQLATERDAVCELDVRLDQESATLQQVRADFAARNAEYDLAGQQLRAIQDELAKSHEESRSLRAELDQAHQRLTDAEVFGQQLADSHGECFRLRDQVRALEIQVVEAASLQDRFDAAQASASQLEAVCAERDQWQEEAQTLKTRHASLSAEREERQHRLEAAQQQLLEEREAVRAAGARLDQESAALQTVRADLAARNAEYSAALQQLQETQTELSCSHEEARDLQAELAQAREHLRDAEALSQQLADTQAKHDQLCAQVPELEGRAASADRLWDQLRAADAETEHLRVQLRVAESKAAELEAMYAQCDRLREQTHTLEIQLAEAADLQARLQAAQASAHELEAVCLERDQWRSEREELRQQLAAAQQQHGEEREAVRAAHLRLDQESATLQQVRADFAARNAEYDLVGQRWQATHHELARAQNETRNLQAELEQAHQRLRDAETLSQQLAGSQAECERLREQARMIETQLAEAAGLQARLETAQASARELEAVCAERDRWQNEAQNLPISVASDSTKQEQLDRLAADLHAAQVEHDRLHTEQQAFQQSVEQACTRVTELERELADAAAAQDRAVAEARAGWESERQALEARLEQERQANKRATQATIRDAQARAAAEREEWRQRIEGAEAQIVWERRMFQEQGEQLRKQSAILQSERDRLSARLSQVESSNRVAEPPPRNEPWVSDFEFFAARKLAEPGRPHVPVQGAWGQTGGSGLSAIEQGVEAAWAAAAAKQQRPVTIHNPPGKVGMQVSEVAAGPEAGGEKTVEQSSAPVTSSAAQANTGEASIPSDALQDTPAALEGTQPGEDLHAWLPQHTDTENKRLWRKFLNFVLRK